MNNAVPAKLTLTPDSFDRTGLYFTGDLDAAKAVIQHDRFAFEEKRQDGSYLVLLKTENDPDAAEDEWGAGKTLEEAWRYALGAALGPYDYDEESITLTVPAR